MTEQEIHDLRSLGHDLMLVSYDTKKKQDRKKLKTAAKLLYNAADFSEDKTNWRARAEWLWTNREFMETQTYKAIAKKMFKYLND